MPAGEEYEASDDHRTLEKEKNMIRVGDEIARVLTDAGLGVLHDRELYDYPNYSGAYNRSLAAIEKYRAEYPSLLYMLDVHRAAVADSEGNNYDVEVPYNYFPDDNPKLTPHFTWRGHASLMYSNWLNFCVYQETPFDLTKLEPLKY